MRPVIAPTGTSTVIFRELSDKIVAIVPIETHAGGIGEVGSLDPHYGPDHS